MPLLPRMEDPEHLRLSAEAIGRDGPIRCTANGSRYPMFHHRPGCQVYPNLAANPYGLGFPTPQAAEAAGHPPCSKCKNKALPTKPVGTRGPQKTAIHPKRAKERMGPREREWDVERKRKVRRDMSPIEYEKYLQRERERHRERRHREREEAEQAD